MQVNSSAVRPPRAKLDDTHAKVSVILPTLNEALNIMRLVDAILKQVADRVEVIVVDDDSPDGTWRVVAEAAQRDPRVRLIHRVGRRGLTSAIQEGIDASIGDIVVWMDCDFSMPPEVIPKLLRAVVKEGYDAAVGSRFVEGGTIKRNLHGSRDNWLGVALSSLLNGIMRLWLGTRFRDYTSGFIACRRALLEDIRLTGDYGEYFMALIYRTQRKGYAIVEIPYICVPRQFGESKTGNDLWQYGRRGIKYIRTAIRLRMVG